MTSNGHSRRHRDRHFLDEPDLARDQQLAKLERLVECMKLCAVADRGEREPRLRALIFDLLATVR